MKKSLNMFAWYLVFVVAVLAAPAPAMVDADFWHHPTGGASPVIDWAVDHTLGAAGRVAVGLWEWVHGE